MNWTVDMLQVRVHLDGHLPGLQENVPSNVELGNLHGTEDFFSIMGQILRPT